MALRFPRDTWHPRDTRGSPSRPFIQENTHRENREQLGDPQVVVVVKFVGVDISIYQSISKARSPQEAKGCPVVVQLEESLMEDRAVRVQHRLPARAQTQNTHFLHKIAASHCN